MNWKMVGQRIRNERKKKKMSQVQLAEKVSCSSAFICQLESGNKKASVETLSKLSKILDVKFF